MATFSPVVGRADLGQPSPQDAFEPGSWQLSGMEKLSDVDNVAVRPHFRPRPMNPTTSRALIALFVVTAAPGVSHAQDGAADRAGAIAVADSALAAITRGDVIGFTDLMLPEAVLFPTGTRDGVFRYRVRTRDEQRAQPMTGVIERGYRPEARVNGPVAMVWYPYDLYINGNWSHCGVDIFTLIRKDGRWRIATMVWSAEQPPTCEKHPAGPPKQ
jgi:hypothetical protein